MSPARSLVIGGARGFIGSAIVDGLRRHGHEVVATSREGGDRRVSNGAELDGLLATTAFDQVVMTPQLTSSDVDWMVDRIDGSRWVVFSSAQLTARAPAPNARVALAREQVALARGAAVLRPTMVFGRGRDHNVSRLARAIRRWRIVPTVGGGAQLVQPVHVEDVASLVVRHREAPSGGLFPVGGDEALPVRELIGMIGELLGVRYAVLDVPGAALHLMAVVGPLTGLRRDQVRRLVEDKMADVAITIETFEWQPRPLPLMLEQAVAEAERC
ncbi:MAG: NAD-dependent epimerase/dehydratase family protein [Acidimicrobiales bacterium]|nr:NAD-dependent epimerase/dehydratase family protein [Acidimicrobiales bacterium]